MRKIQIIKNLANRNCQIQKDLIMSAGGSVFKYTEPLGATKRLYILESNIQDPVWGMNISVIKRLVSTIDNFIVILLSTSNQESYLISREEIVNLYNGQLQILYTNKNGKIIITKGEMCKLNSRYLKGDTALINVINML